MNFWKIIINIEPKYNWIPLHMIERYYLAIHSPKSIPEFYYGTNFFEIKTNKISAVTYNKINIDIEIENNCQDYNDEFLRSDCIAICVMNKIQNKLGHVKAIETQFLFRKDYSKFLLAHNQTLNRNHDEFETVTEFKTECMQQCKRDCSFEYYLFDINQGGQIPDDKIHRKSQIFIHHKQIPDIYIKHISETTFISFISNFGGLLGMWLGISVILIFENILKFLKNISDKFCKSATPILFVDRSIQLNPNFHINHVQINQTCRCQKHNNYVGDLPSN